MKEIVEIYKDSKLIRTEEVEMPDPELTPEQKDIEVLKQRVSALEAVKAR